MSVVYSQVKAADSMASGPAQALRELKGQGLDAIRHPRLLVRIATMLLSVSGLENGAHHDQRLSFVTDHVRTINQNEISHFNYKNTIGRESAGPIAARSSRDDGIPRHTAAYARPACGSGCLFPRSEFRRHPAPSGVIRRHPADDRQGHSAAN